LITSVNRFLHTLKSNTRVLLLLRFTFIVFSCTFIFIKGILPGWKTIFSDFPNYYVSAKMVAENKEVKKLYDNDWFQQQIENSGINVLGRFTPHPPLTALFLLPIAKLPPLVAKRIWLLFSLILLFGCILLLRVLYDLDWLKSSFVLLFMGKALAYDLYYGQLYIFVSFSLLLILFLIERKNWFWVAGFLLAIITALKYFPIILVAYALLTKKYKVFFSFCLTLIGLAVFQFFYFGWELNAFYLNDIVIAHFSGDIPGQGSFSMTFQSWVSFFSQLFIYDSIQNPNPTFNFLLGKQIGIILVYSVIIFVNLFLVSKLWKTISNNDTKKNLLLLLFISGLVLLPASATYHFLFLIIPTAIILSINRVNVFHILFLFLILIINYFPHPFSSNENVFLLILSFPRLFSVSGLLIIVYIIIYQHSKLYIIKNGKASFSSKY